MRSRSVDLAHRDHRPGAIDDQIDQWGTAPPAGPGSERVVGTAVTVLYHGKVETVVVDEPSGWWLYVVPIEPAAAAGEIPVRI